MLLEILFGSLLKEQKAVNALICIVFVGFGSCFWLRFVKGLNWPTKRTSPPGPKNFLELLVKLRCFFFSGDINLTSKILEAEYGKVVGISSFWSKTVVISDFGTLQAAFKNHAILDRPPAGFSQLIDDGIDRGIAFSSGETWRAMRKFTVSQLMNRGLREKTKLDLIISEQVEECVDLMKRKMDQPFSTKHFFDIPVVNILWKIISGKKFSLNDPEAQNLVHCIEQNTNSYLQMAVLSHYPRLGPWLLYFMCIKNPFPDTSRYFQSFTSNFLQGHLKTRDCQEETKENFTDSFLQKIHSTKDVNSPFFGQLGSENLQETITDLFVVGSETTSNTLSWALLYLALHPDKQEKLQAEIDVTLGTQTPSLQDKSKMKYTEAVINETLRKSALAPFGVPHATSQDTTIGKFHVEKGTTVFGNVYAIHHCEETWGDPYIFRPERFLTEDETALIKRDGFVPFGIGTRICPGIALAYDELFMFITSIFQEFTITWNPKEPKPDMKPQLGFALTPLPHQLIITTRL